MKCSFIIGGTLNKPIYCPSEAHNDKEMLLDDLEDPYCSHHQRVVEAQRTKRKGGSEQ